MKWIMRLTSIMTGRNILLAITNTVGLVLAVGCGDKYKLPDLFVAQIHNTTSLPVVIHFKSRSYGYTPNDTLAVNANDSIIVDKLTAKFKRVSKEDDPYPIKKFFEGFTVVEVTVYRSDSSKVVWGEPAVDLPDSIHSFFNYNSWELEMLGGEFPNPKGILKFYIQEDDFK